MLVVYKSDTEMFVCDEKDEKDLLRNYFGKKAGRDLDDYDRAEAEQFVEITPRLITCEV
jgi:hypothetical protein